MCLLLVNKPPHAPTGFLSRGAAALSRPTHQRETPCYHPDSPELLVAPPKRNTR